MRESYDTPARDYARGIGDAVADRTINRKITKTYNTPIWETISIPRRDDISLDSEVSAFCESKGWIPEGYRVTFGDEHLVTAEVKISGEKRIEKWADVAERVALGNTLLADDEDGQEFNSLHHHLRQASILMSGRHLQHGDETQPTRNMEVFTNCSTSAASFLTFYLLLNGSGVGRAYDDALMLVDWSNMPVVVPVIDMHHKDAQSGEIIAMDARTAKHLFAHKKIHEILVPDSREGWTKAIETMETMAYEGKYRDDVLLLDFSKVRPRGAPIGGMQNRPASGPGPLMAAIRNMAQVRDAGMPRWLQAMYVDHYAAECVLVGGARRAARMSTKTWRDKSVLDFVSIKRGGFLWSSNNSVTVDAEFWALVRAKKAPRGSEMLWAHAHEVYEAIVKHSYGDGTGEPGIINQDMLTQNDGGMSVYDDGNYAESARYKLSEQTLKLTRELVRAVKGAKYKMITNPCGEITLLMLGGYCVIADVVPFHAVTDFYAAGVEQKDFSLWDNDAEDAFRVTTRALIRVNLMDSLYGKEVRRTNRIGVGLTGLHEYAWARFSYGFRDLIDEEKSKDFWLMLARFKRAVVDEAKTYSKKLGVAIPHTDTTIKPAGTTSKLFGLTEGAHLPSMREYLRWVQFRYDDPLVDNYRDMCYPVRALKTYSGTIIVGFPTQPLICTLGMGDKLVTAAEATPEEQYQWLRLIEKYWIRGVKEDGVTPLSESGNQVSYTLKMDLTKVSEDDFRKALLDGQATVRCCSVMPFTDTGYSAYEYLPEQPVTKHEYEMIVQAIQEAAVGEVDEIKEDIGAEHVDCASGACPISWNENSAASA